MLEGDSGGVYEGGDHIVDRKLVYPILPFVCVLRVRAYAERDEDPRTTGLALAVCE